MKTVAIVNGSHVAAVFLHGFYMDLITDFTSSSQNNYRKDIVYI